MRRPTSRIGFDPSVSTRRQAIQLGALTAFGMTLPQLLRRPADAGCSHRSTRARSCILLWLDGGPSHLETLDPKPESPVEVRGPFDAISTAVPGLFLSELMTQTAQIANQLTIVRSLTSPLGEHGLANTYLQTGYQPSPVIRYPGMAAVSAFLRPSGSALPDWIAIPNAGSMNAGFLSDSVQAFETGGDPAKPDFRIRDLDFFPEVGLERLQRRRSFLRELDRESAAQPDDPALVQAMTLLEAANVREAFDLQQEDARTRSHYGGRTFGQSCLLARRLVERGVPFVTINSRGWDTHEDLTLRLRDGFTGANPGVGLIPLFDQAFAALVSDLDDRGMLDETLVIAMGEFGRTPRINTRGGRDHWPRVFSAALAGGGVPSGQIIGASDRIGESPADTPVSPADLVCSVYSLLGIDPRTEMQTADGRPIQVNRNGKPIPQLTSLAGE